MYLRFVGKKETSLDTCRPLSVIRNKGRQIYLENPSQNFSRIVHDYTDEKKGFIIWKDMLEEQLV